MSDHTKNSKEKPGSETGTLRDILEINPMNTEQEFEKYISEAPYGIFISNSEGKYLWINDIACKMMGRSKEQLLKSGIGTGLLPEGKEHSRMLLSEVREQGRAEREISFERTDGSSGTWLINAVKLGGDRFMAYCMDITEQKRTERALLESEARYRALFGGIRSGVAVYKAVDEGDDFEYVDFNPSVNRVENIEWKDVIGKRVTEVFPAVKNLGLLDVFRRVYRTGVPEHHPVTFQHGGVMTGWRDNYVYRLPSGEIVSIYDDITDRKLAEIALRESEENFHTFMDNLPAAVFLKDSEGKYIFINRYMREVFGADEKWLGRSTQECYPETTANLLVSDDMKAVQEGYAVYIRKVVDARGNERFFETHKFRISKEEGKELLGGIALDISEKLKARLDLEESEECFRAFMDFIPGAAFLKDAEGRYKHLNRYFRDNMNVDNSWIGKTSMECIPGDAGRQMFNDDKLVIRDGYLMRIEIVKDDLGNERIFEAHKFPIPRKDGKILIGAIALDVTEKAHAEKDRKNLEAQIQHTQKLESLGVLAGGIAHDFNNILMAILGYSDLALLDLDPASPARPSIKEIEKAARNAADLAKQMLAYSGKGRFQLVKLDMNKIIREMTHLLSISISKNAVIKYHLAENLPPVEADAAQMRQFIMNLITNASEALETTSGIISLTTSAMECDSDYLKTAYLNEDLPGGLFTYIEVADTGCGMDEEALSKLFDPFFTTKSTGRGLGLSAVLGIGRGHKGALKVYTEPGKGTSFKILFPACTGEVSESNQIDEEEITNLPGGTILLVDDEESVRTVGKTMLERKGFDVLTSVDGLHALKIFKERHDDIVCVILDLTMPHLDGEETFREMRRIKKDVRVILSSGYNEQDVTQKFVGKGLAGFIQKPYQLKDLLIKLKEVIGKTTDPVKTEDDG